MRIFVTGIGMTTALASDAAGSFEAVLAGRRSQGAVSLFELPGSRATTVCACSDIPADSSASTGGSRSEMFAWAAAREALAQAKLGQTMGGQGEPISLVVGGTTAGMFETELLLAEAGRSADPRQWKSRPELFSHPLSAVAASLCREVYPFREARTVCSACTSGATALMVALSMLLNGSCQRVLAGGSDGLCRLTLAGFNALAALDPEPCRPFDQGRAGLNLGEGAAFLLLETESSARDRAVVPFAELRAVAQASEAHHLTQPQADGSTATEVMVQALQDGGVTASDVGYLNCHGTGTRRNDAMEAIAIHACFGDALTQLRLSSTKGQHGHTLGAAGAVEAAIAVMALHQGKLPPNVGLVEPLDDPPLPLLHQAEPREIVAAMSNNFGFGGTDAAVLFARPRRFASLRPARQAVFVHGSFSWGALGLLSNQQHAGYLGEASQSVSKSEDDLKLDARRSRRMRRAARLVAAVGERAMATWDEQPQRVGAVLGSAFGAVDGCASFVARLMEKGARFASPASFPALLPSSAVAQAGIYLGLQGPVLSSHALHASGLHAVAIAADLLQAGQAQALLAGAVEEWSELAEQVFQNETSLERGEGCAVLSLSCRPQRAVARLSHWHAASSSLCDVPPPDNASRSACLLVGTNSEVPDAWANSAPLRLADVVGGHEGRSTFALAVATGLIEERRFDEVLVLARVEREACSFVVSKP